MRSITATSAAEKAGLRRSDIITALNDQPVLDASSFVHAVRKLQPGQTAKLAVLRGKEAAVIEPVIGEYRGQLADGLSEDSRALQQIEAEEVILARLPLAGCEQERAQALVYLGSAYGRLRTAGGASELDEQSIKYLEQGLPGLDPAKLPKDWVAAHINLGLAYRRRSFGNRAENMEKAIKAYETALAVTNETIPQIDKGRALMGFGIGLLNRSSGARAENIEQAIEKFRAAEHTFDPAAFPRDWGDLHRVLANAYLDRFEGLRERNIEQAIAALEIAANAYSANAFPNERSAALTQLAKLKAERIPERAHN